MVIKYTMADPTGNVTALVETEVPIERHSEIAKAVMEKEISCEQVGFILPSQEGSDITLRMAGGEFCGNATMSAAAFFCRSNSIENIRTVKVKAVGTPGLIEVKIEKREGYYTGTIEMPVPRRLFNQKFVFEGHNYYYPVVEFDGISHIIIEDDIPVYMPEACIKMWCDSLHVKCLGIMIIDRDKSGLRPLVYVKNPETLVWESSCASGTTAVGAFFSQKAGRPVRMELKEPGGKLIVETFADNTIELTGSIVFY